MLAGALDRRLEILRSPIVDDGFSSGPGDPVKIGEVWASKKDISDGERLRNGISEAVATTRFQIRWSDFAAGITTRDRLRCGGVEYNITGIKELGRRVGREITAASIA